MDDPDGSGMWVCDELSLWTTLLSAGQLLLDRLNSDFSISAKGTDDIVTSVDLEVGHILRHAIGRRYPEDRIICEDIDDASVDTSGKGAMWFIDPLDGTLNYVHGGPLFGISASRFCCERQRSLFSAVYFPMVGSMFVAIGDQTAMLNGTAIGVSHRSSLSELLVVAGISSRSDQAQISAFERVTRLTAGTRRSGCATWDLCCVAAGRVDAAIHYNLRPWDIAAGRHLIRNAGGTLTNVGSASFAWHNQTVFASNGACHGLLERLISA